MTAFLGMRGYFLVGKGKLKKATKYGSEYVQELNLQIVDAAFPRITEEAVGREWRAAGADER